LIHRAQYPLSGARAPLPVYRRLGAAPTLAGRLRAPRPAPGDAARAAGDLGCRARGFTNSVGGGLLRGAAGRRRVRVGAARLPPPDAHSRRPPDDDADTATTTAHARRRLLAP